MMKDTRNTGSGIRYNFYLEELKRAENPYTVYAAYAMTIAKCKEYTKPEKGRELVMLTRAWMDLFEMN